MYKIKNKLVNGYIIEIAPKIYGAVIEDDYDRAMLFCRYQEFYESPYKQIRGKYFTLIEFMRTYVKERKADMFTYPWDWSGYNIPSAVLEKAHDVFYKETEYDVIMNDIIFYCSNDSMRKNNDTRTKWYLIGADNFKSKTMNHEIAHGLYFTNKRYKKSCDLLISEMKKRDYNLVKKALIKMGYADDSKIIDDEIQAFFSTGLYKSFDNEDTRKYTKKFSDNLADYYKAK
jgi:hypothetical protein